MNDMLIEILEELDDNIQELQGRLNDLERVDLSKIVLDIQNFIKEFEEDDIINFELLENFYDKLDSKDIKKIDEYKQLMVLINNLKPINGMGLFDSDINSAKKIFRNLVVEIKKVQNRLFKDINNIGYQKRLLNSKILLYKKIMILLESVKSNKIISQENFNSICEYILNENDKLTDDQKKQFIFELTSQNSKLMDSKIKLAIVKENRIREQQKLKEQRKLEEEIKKKQKLEKIQKDVEEDDLLSEKVKNNDQIGLINDVNILLRQLLSDEQYEMYFNAKEICSKFSSDNEKIELLVKSLTSMSTIEERNIIYLTFSDLKEREHFIVRDIAENVLKIIENDILSGKVNLNAFENLNVLLIEYNKVVFEQNENKNSRKFDYIATLKEYGMISELDVCYKIDELIEKCLKDCKNDKGLKNTSTQFIENLVQSKEDFVQSLKEYQLDKSLGTKELVELCFEDMYEKYNELRDIYDKFIYSSLDKKQELLNISQEFYSNVSEIKNIIVFVNDDGSIIPIIESDIENDRRILDKEKRYNAILHKLRLMVSSDFIAGQGQSRDDKVKSRGFSEEFLNEFKVKSTHNGYARIFYSRFNTTLNEVLPEFSDNVHVLFIYEVGYGNTDGNKKAEINKIAIDRCYADSENIKAIKDLLNTDWKVITSGEKERKIKLIREYLTRQNIKLGHFIAKGNSPKLVPEKGDR